MSKRLKAEQNHQPTLFELEKPLEPPSRCAPQKIKNQYAIEMSQCYICPRSCPHGFLRSTAVVLDLGEISWVDGRRIDLSTWFRFRRAVENTPTILVLLGEESCAKSCASLVLRCQRGANHWSRTAASVEAGISTFEGFEVEGEVTRSRVLSQPADLARWQTQTP